MAVSCKTRVAALILGLALPLAMAELGLRLMPVATGMSSEWVDEQQPVFRFRPDHSFTYSKDWNFALANVGRINNAGFVSHIDYRVDDPRPLMAVIGDSYVEAAMVPWPETLQGRLSGRLAEKARVYSFAASGAPLSQYLVWARHARDTYGMQALTVVVVGNDFDESLSRYKRGPGFHHFREKPDGGLELERVDNKPGILRDIATSSALIRYVMLNLRAPSVLAGLAQGNWRAARPAQAEAYVGNVAAEVSDERRGLSRAAVEAFLGEVPAAAGLPRDRIAFLVDGLRYPWVDRDGRSYFREMRGHFIRQARALGHEVVDMDEVFLPHVATHPQARFEYPTDAHWNGLAHGLAEGALADTRVVRGLVSPPPQGI